MLKIRPLNRDSLSDEDAPVLRKELQEEIALEIYNKALRYEAKGEFAETRKLLFQLINENIPQLESQGGLPKSMSTLKYSCFLNIGNTYLAENNNEDALGSYLSASDLDETDVTLWYKIGKLALKENRFRQSIYAFSKGLDCNESHWPCLDELITLLFAVRDTIGCLYYIGKALILDADYIKGLAFRKQIYRENPASKEYYQKSNPDYIWEPSLDVEVDEEDEKKYLNEVQVIIDRIREAEKALESKPLSTISLPKGLESYSWMAVSKSVFSLYEYIRSNEMSFFTFVDINKCMSQVGILKMDLESNIKDEKPTLICPDVEKSENVAGTDTEDKMEVDTVIERRLSQNSEENGTPSQTDNDDEQPTEQETEEQEERNERRPRGYKRKRDLLLDLRVWGWHSKRKHVRKSKPDKFHTVEDCLNQILPTHLLRNKVGDAYNQDDSVNTTDIYNMILEDRKTQILSPIHSPKSSSTEPYFGTDREKEDVIRSWTRPREYCDTCVLVKEFIIDLSKFWQTKWPKELISQYIIIYEMYREFSSLPNMYDSENVFEDMRDEILATLLYAELVLFSCPEDLEKGRALHIGHIQFLETMTLLWEHSWGQEYATVFSRVFWLKVYIYRKEGNNEHAVRCLQLIEEMLTEQESKTDEKFIITLPNSYKCGFVSIDVTTKILKHLDMIKSLSCLEDLYNEGKYEDVAEIVKTTFASSTGCPTFGRVGRPAQLGILMHALWFTDLEQCFIWSEECLFEAHAQYSKPGPDRIRWEKVVEKCLGIMHEIIKMKSNDIVDLLLDDRKARLTETLAKIICKQINTENTKVIPLNTITPWILLHYILAKDERKQLKECSSNEEDNEPSVPPSLSILFSAHELLGPKSWCLTSQGELLHFILDVLLDKEDAYKYERLREKLDIHIEQALFCLYQHPSKKNKISRHLADHNVDPLRLTWEKSFQLYEFYAPEVLPEFNSFKNASISADLEQLLLRIIALVTPECDPSVSIPKINEYLQGKTNTIPDPIQFPNRIRAIYFLLGDYYFKLREFVRCVKYFLMDIAINPRRVDSWACLGLSYFNQLEIKLNFCKTIENEEEFLEIAKYAQVGFKSALDLSPDDITLWIEFGTFEYMAHSFCSRYLKFESENMSMERFEYLEDKKNIFLDSSGQSFEKAIALYEMNDNEPDERWLQYYILGKIAEKKQAEPKEYLHYYLAASQLLHENNASYPDKINYNSPQHLSVEVLELHYRINASILKYLELHERKDIHHTIGSLFKKTLDALVINQNLAAQKAQKKLEKSAKSKLKNQKPDDMNKTESTQQEKEAAPVDKSGIEETLPVNKPSLETETEKKPTQEIDPGNQTSQETGKQNSSEKIELEMKTNLTENVAVCIEDETMKNKMDEVEGKETETVSKNQTENLHTKNDDLVLQADSEEIIVQSSEARSVNDASLHEIVSDSQEMEREIQESVSYLLQKVEEMDKEAQKDHDPVVKVVDEVILLDAEYDVIMILSSDEDSFREDTDSKQVSPKSTEIEARDDELNEKVEDNTMEVDAISDEQAKAATGDDTSLIHHNIEHSENIDIEQKDVTPPENEIKGMEIEKADDEKSYETKRLENSNGGKFSEKKVLDVQQVLDKMMEETMQRSAEQHAEGDSDTSILDKSIEVVESSKEYKVTSNTEDSDKRTEECTEEFSITRKESNQNDADANCDADNKKSTEESSSSSSSSGSSDSSSSSESDSDDDMSSSSSSSSESSSSENLSTNEVLHLVDRCIKGLEQCIIRLPKNYKAIYRLAHLFFNYKARKDTNKCKQLLLGEYKCYENSSVTGLFADRKDNNFFNGIWRIPSSEIDRPGSLSAHMIRCVTILLQMLKTTNDCKILLDLYFQLRKKPDSDKIYIKDSERLQFSEQALSLYIQIFRNMMKNTDKMDNATMRKLLHDIHRAYSKMKDVPGRQLEFGNMLVDVYKKFIKEKIPDNVNILDLAIKFCQQTKMLEKSKNVLTTHNMSPQNPLVPMGPVLPSPSTVSTGNMVPQKRSSGVGRPRGRPPLPKSLTPKSRGKSPVASSINQASRKKAATEQTYAYDYIKHYQEELMKQYNQNLNYMQMAQLMQMYPNPSAFANAYLQAQQTSLLNSNLFSQLTGLGTSGTVMDKAKISQMETLQNKFKEMMAAMSTSSSLGNLTIDQLMASNSTKSSSSSKKQKPTSSTNIINTNPIKLPNQQESKVAPEKPKTSKQSKEFHDHVRSSGLVEIPKLSSNTSHPKISSQTAKVISVTSVGDITTQKVKKEMSTGSCISSISIIPTEKVAVTSYDNIRDFDHLKIGASITKVPSNTSSVKPPEVLSTIHPTLAQIEATVNKVSGATSKVPLKPCHSPLISPYSSVIMPPPNSILPSVTSPLTISASCGNSCSKLPSPQNIKQSSLHNVKLTSPQNVKVPSPQNVKLLSPQNVKLPSPHSIKSPSPQSIKSPSPQNIKSPSPHNIKSPSPQNVKLLSPTNIPSPLSALDPSNSLPNLNIEAMISRVSPIQPEFHKKHSPTIHAIPPSIALEVGLPKFPSSLSMTPVDFPSRSKPEPHHSISIHKVASSKPDPYVSKIPSSITLTPSSKSGSIKHASLESCYTKPRPSHSVSKSGIQQSLSSKSSLQNSTIGIKQSKQTGQVLPKVPTDKNMSSKIVPLTDYPKFPKDVSLSAARKPESSQGLTPFNIESMLQPSTKAKNYSSTSSTYAYSQLPTQKVIHTSVIKSANVSSTMGRNLAMDSNISPTFTHPSSVNSLSIGRSSSKPSPIDMKNVAPSSMASKMKTVQRTMASDIYQDVHQTNTNYAATQHDQNIMSSRTARASPTSVISTIPRTSPTSSFIPPHISTSPGKTLQEKLADKKREQANKQLFQQKEMYESSQHHPKEPSTFANPHSISKMLSRR